MIRVGVVGIGFGQHVHVPAFRTDARVRVEALCASTAERARTVADRLGVTKASGRWQDLVADPELDALAVSVPPSLQPEIACAAAKAGKHLFLEKPLARDAAGAQAIVDAARRVVATVDFELREIPAWQRAHAYLAEGRIGNLRHASIAWRVDTRAYREAATTWKRDLDAGGGTLNLFGSHAVDAIAWLFGPVRRVMGWLRPSAGADAGVEAWLELATGAPVTLSIAADAPFGSGHCIEAYGDEGALVLDNATTDYVNGFTLSAGRRGEKLARVDVPEMPANTDGRVFAVGQLVRRFVDAIEQRQPISPSLDEGLAAQRLMDAIRASHESRSWQS